MMKAVEFVLALLVVATTLNFGGVKPVAYTLLEVGVFLSILPVLHKKASTDEASLNLPLWPLLFALWLLLQTVPLPLWLVMSLSPGRHSDPYLSSTVGSQLRFATLSIYPHETVLTLVKFLAYLCAFFLAASLFDSRKRKSTLVNALVLIGFLEAVYAVVQFLTDSRNIFTYTNPYATGSATGTYINRNHYAGLLELTIPFVTGSVFYFFQLWSEQRKTAVRAPEVKRSPGFRLVFYLFLLVILMVGVILSRSRMGIVATLLSLMSVALLAQIKIKRRAWLLGVFLFLLCVAGYGMWIGLAPVLARFEPLRERGNIQMEGRIMLWRDSLRLIGDYPLAGTGLGTFGLAFRRYQTTMVDSVADHAHNDYLQYVAETGIPGAALFFLPILYLFYRMVFSFFDDPRGYRRSVTLGCIGSTLALLLHSITDFNLQIPANAFIFAIVLGIAYKVAVIERREELQTHFGSPG